MSDVMRFNMIPAGQPNPSANGLYVRYEDYAALEAELERAKTVRVQSAVYKAERDAALAECERLREALQKFADLGIESGNSKWPELDEALACCKAALSAIP